MLTPSRLPRSDRACWRPTCPVPGGLTGVSSARMSIMSVALSKLQVWLAPSWQLQGQARWPTCGVFVVSGSRLELSRGGWAASWAPGGVS